MIDWNMIMQGAMLAGVLWQVRTVSRLVTVCELHNYRINQLEGKRSCSASQDVSTSH